jgi:hypothetical protein
VDALQILLDKIQHWKKSKRSKKYHIKYKIVFFFFIYSELRNLFENQHKHNNVYKKKLNLKKQNETQRDADFSNTQEEGKMD